MVRHIILIAGLLTLATPAMAQGGHSYRAAGTEPFWTVTIQGGRLIYSDAENRRVDVRAPRPAVSQAGHRYDTRRIVLLVTTGRACSDGMSDRRYRDTVRVIVDGRRLHGCGGGIARGGGRH